MVDQAGAAWLAQRHWAPRRGHAGLAGPLDRGESPSGAAPVTVEEAAVLVSARRVARWMRVWRPRSRTVRERVLFFGGADTVWPDVADTSARMTMRFDADEQAREVARVHGYSEGIGVQPELFDALIERICAEIYLADRIVLLASTPPMVALAAVGAIDALQGSLSGWTGEIENAAAEPWLPPVDDQWAPQAYTESDHAQLLSAKLEAALSVPLAAL